MSSGIFTQPKRLYAPMGLGSCGCGGKKTATGEIFGQPTGEFAVSAVLWSAGVVALYFVFKGLKKPTTR